MQPSLRAVQALLLVLAFTALVPVVAYAQPRPVRLSPRPNATLNEAPPRVDIWFDEPIAAGLTSLDVRSPRGENVSTGPVIIDTADPTHVSVTLRPNLAPGRYVVVWQASSRSGDAMSGDVFAPTLAAGVDTTQHRIKVILGVLGVAVSVLMAGGVGYLLRRRLGLAHTYEDGFTPKDPH